MTAGQGEAVVGESRSREAGGEVTAIATVGQSLRHVVETAGDGSRRNFMAGGAFLVGRREDAGLKAFMASEACGGGMRPDQCESIARVVRDLALRSPIHLPMAFLAFLTELAEVRILMATGAALRGEGGHGASIVVAS